MNPSGEVEYSESCLKNVLPFLAGFFSPAMVVGLRLVAAVAPGMYYRAARVDQDLVGVFVARKARRAWEVVSIAVSPGYRKSGIGRRFLASFLESAGRENVAVVAYIRKSNRASRALATALGFRRERVWSFPFLFEELLPWGDHFVWRPK